MSPHAEIARLTVLINDLRSRPNQQHAVAVLERRIEVLRSQLPQD